MRKILSILFVALTLTGIAQNYRPDRYIVYPPTYTNHATFRAGELATAAADLYCAEAYSLFARMTTPPTDTRKTLIDKTIKDLKTAGIWAKLDVLYFLASADEQAALLNWIADTNNATVVTGGGTMTFVADDYYQPDGVNSYLNTNFNPYTEGVQYKKDTACAFIYIKENGNKEDGCDFGFLSGSADGTFLQYGTAIELNRFRVSDATTSNGGTNKPRSTGMYVITRLGGVKKIHYASTSTTVSLASAGTVSANIYIGRINFASPFPQNGKYSAWGAGRYLTDTEVADLKTIVNYYIANL